MFRIGLPDTKVAEKCIQSTAEFFALGAQVNLPVSKVIIPITWRKPLEGWEKLNTNGLALGNPGKAGGGDLIRDHNGDWIIGFSRSLGSTNNFIVELWALRDGLTLAG